MSHEMSCTPAIGMDSPAIGMETPAIGMEPLATEMDASQFLKTEILE